jgi:hypothetical protein
MTFPTPHTGHSRHGLFFTRLYCQSNAKPTEKDHNLPRIHLGYLWSSSQHTPPLHHLGRYKLLPPTITLTQTCSNKSPSTRVIRSLFWTLFSKPLLHLHRFFQERSVTPLNYVHVVKEFLITEVIVKIRFQQYDNIKVGRANGQVKLISLLSCPVHILEINGKIRKLRDRNGSWAVSSNITMQE